jgi:hypothetical protein
MCGIKAISTSSWTTDNPRTSSFLLTTSKFIHTEKIENSLLWMKNKLSILIDKEVKICISYTFVKLPLSRRQAKAKIQSLLI